MEWRRCMGLPLNARSLGTCWREKLGHEEKLKRGASKGSTEKRRKMVEQLMNVAMSGKAFHDTRSYLKVEREGVAMLPDLIDLIKKRDVFGVTIACDVIGDMGGYAAPAVPELKNALSSEDWMTRSAAAEALGNLGPPAKTCVPVLRKMLNDENGTVRRYAAEALILLGGVNDDATLRKVLDTDYYKFFFRRSRRSSFEQTDFFIEKTGTILSICSLLKENLNRFDDEFPMLSVLWDSIHCQVGVGEY